MTNMIKTKVMEHLEYLPENLQEQVLAYVESLQRIAGRGVRGKELLQFAGTIPPDDLELMQQAIERGCERVDLNEW